MILSWTLFILYMLGTSYLGWLGYKKTVNDFGSFAIGNGDMSAGVVGVTLATSTASAATFIINPGFVYVHGLSAFLHLGVSVFVGILFMLILLSFSFRRQGDAFKALTIPDWIGKRYHSPNFSLYFAFINLLGFAFIVLIVGGISIVMQPLLGVSNVVALIITLVFVTTYVMFGGTYAHVYTNMFQGFLMIAISLLVIASGIWIMFFSDYQLFHELRRTQPELLTVINLKSNLFNTPFAVYISGFLIGAALVCQPHILTKALYVKEDKDVRNYIIVFAGVYILFTLLLMVGFWAHAVVSDAALLDSTGAFRQDLVMTVYLQEMFPDWVFSVVSIVLLAAAMSTLDGLLIGMSTITSNDLILNIMKRRSNHNMSHEMQMKWANRSSHIVLVVLAILTYWVNINPPKLLGIFGQVGVYGLVLAAVPPLVNGVLFKNSNTTTVWVLSVLAICTHFFLYFYGSQFFPNSNLTFSNPGVTASLGVIVSIIPTLLIGLWKK
jgi:sodium/pantothenate symporter